MNPKADRTEALLFLILCLSLALRVHDLGAKSLSFDEGFSISAAKLDVTQTVISCFRDYHPPLYFMFLHYWISLFGDSEFYARLPSTVFGLLTVFAAYRIGRLLSGREVGLMASLLTGLSSFHIYCSQEARPYSLLALLSVASMYFFITLQEKRGLLAPAGYVVSTALMLYTHYYGLFVLLAQNIHLAAAALPTNGEHKPDYRRWITLQSAVILIFAPWATVTAGQAARVQQWFWVPDEPLEHLAYTAVLYAGSETILLIFLALALLAAASRQDPGRLRLQLAWLTMPIALPSIISLFSTPIYMPKYTIPATIPFYLLASAGICGVKDGRVRLAVVCIIVALSLMNVGDYYGKATRPPWRMIVEDVEANARPGDLVIIIPKNTHKFLYDHYSRRKDLTETPLIDYASNTSEVIQGIKKAAEGRERAWVLVEFNNIDETLLGESLKPYRIAYSKEYWFEDMLWGRKYFDSEVYLLEKT